MKHKYKPIMFRSMIVFATSILMTLSGSAYSSAILDIISPQQVRVGETFTIDIVIENNDFFRLDTRGYSLDVYWSGNTFSTSSNNVTFGDFGGDPNPLPPSLNTAGFFSDPPYMSLHHETTPGYNSPESYSLASIEFVAINPNTATSFLLSVSDLYDDSFQDISYTFQDGRPSIIPGATIVSDIRVVSEPPALFVVIIGIMSLVFTRMRRQVENPSRRYLSVRNPTMA